MGKPHSVFFLTSPHQGFDAIFTNLGDDLVLSHFFGKDIVKRVGPNIEANEELCRGILVYLQYSGVNSIDSKKILVRYTYARRAMPYDHVVNANCKSPDIMTLCKKGLLAPTDSPPEIDEVGKESNNK